MTTKHTPTPWSSDGRSHRKSNFGTNFARVEAWEIDPVRAEKMVSVTVADCLGSYKDDPVIAKANAAFIVRACNAHDELVKTVNLFQQFFDKTPKGQFGRIVCDIGLMNDAFISAQKALAKAKGD